MGRQTVQLFWLIQQRDDMRKKVRVRVMSSQPRIIEAVQLSLLNGNGNGNGRKAFSKDLTEKEICLHRRQMSG